VAVDSKPNCQLSSAILVCATDVQTY